MAGPTRSGIPNRNLPSPVGVAPRLGGKLPWIEFKQFRPGPPQGMGEGFGGDGIGREIGWERQQQYVSSGAGSERPVAEDRSVLSAGAAFGVADCLLQGAVGLERIRQCMAGAGRCKIAFGLGEAAGGADGKALGVAALVEHEDVAALATLGPEPGDAGEVVIGPGSLVP